MMTVNFMKQVVFDIEKFDEFRELMLKSLRNSNPWQARTSRMTTEEVLKEQERFSNYIKKIKNENNSQ